MDLQPVKPRFLSIYGSFNGPNQKKATRYSKVNSGRLTAIQGNSYFNSNMSITEKSSDHFRTSKATKSVNLRSINQTPLKPSSKVTGPLFGSPSKSPGITAKALMNKLKLEPLGGEGGYFRRIYESSVMHGNNFAATSIYFMLTPDQPVSHLHRLKSDEIWYFHAGKSITIIEVDNGKVTKTVLGNDLQAVMEDRMVMSHIVKAGVWFGSYLNSKTDFSVVSCTVVPGFQFEDFEVLYQKKADGFEIPQDLQFMIATK